MKTFRRIGLFTILIVAMTAPVFLTCVSDDNDDTEVEEAHASSTLIVGNVEPAAGESGPPAGADVYMEGDSNVHTVVAEDGSYTLGIPDDQFVDKAGLVVFSEKIVNLYVVHGQDTETNAAKFGIKQDQISVIFGEQTEAPEATLKETGSVTGTMTQGETSQHVGSTIDVSGTIFTTTTDSRGNYTIYGLPEGAWGVSTQGADGNVVPLFERITVKEKQQARMEKVAYYRNLKNFVVSCNAGDSIFIGGKCRNLSELKTSTTFKSSRFLQCSQAVANGQDASELLGKAAIKIDRIACQSNTSDGVLSVTPDGKVNFSGEFKSDFNLFICIVTDTSKAHHQVSLAFSSSAEEGCQEAGDDLRTAIKNRMKESIAKIIEEKAQAKTGDLEESLPEGIQGSVKDSIKDVNLGGLKIP